MKNASELKIQRTKMKMVDTKLSTTETHIIHFKDEHEIDWILTVTYRKGFKIEVLPSGYSEQKYKLQTPEIRNNLCAFVVEMVEKNQISETKEELLANLLNLRNFFNRYISTYQNKFNRHDDDTEIYLKEIEKTNLIIKKYHPEIF